MLNSDFIYLFFLLLLFTAVNVFTWNRRKGSCNYNYVLTVREAIKLPPTEMRIVWLETWQPYILTRKWDFFPSFLVCFLLLTIKSRKWWVGDLGRQPCHPLESQHVMVFTGSCEGWWAFNLRLPPFFLLSSLPVCQYVTAKDTFFFSPYASPLFFSCWSQAIQVSVVLPLVICVTSIAGS